MTAAMNEVENWPEQPKARSHGNQALNELDCWQTAASEALTDIWFTDTRYETAHWLAAVDTLLPDMEELGDSAEHLGRQFCRIGAITIANNPQLTFAHVLDTVIGKQRDYGHGNILRFGLTGVVVRMADKIERMKNLLRLEAKSLASQSNDGFSPVNESIDDTALDIVGYCLIAVMLLSDTFTRELA